MEFDLEFETEIGLAPLLAAIPQNDKNGVLE